MNGKWYSVGKLKYVSDSAVSKKIFEGDVDATLLSMSAGTETSGHTFAKDGIMFVLEGAGVMELDGKKMPLHAGVMIRLDKRVVYSIRAEENMSFILQIS